MQVKELHNIPLPLEMVCGSISRALPPEAEDKFRADLNEAIGTGDRDLSRVVWAFLAAELRGMPEQTGAVKFSIDAVIKGMELLASGKVWSRAGRAHTAFYDAYGDTDAADAAILAAYAANAAGYAALYAADAAAGLAAADAAARLAVADPAARQRQAANMIELIEAA